MSALLGRPLTSYEDTNYDLYLKIARQNLDTLLCTNFCDNEVERIFDANNGYSTVWTDVFTDIDEVTIDGDVVANFTKRQGDNRRGSWFNSIVFDKRFTKDKEVTITATWGFSSTPSDLQALLAAMFDLGSKKKRFDGTIQRKQVEDFEITFNANTDLDDEFYRNYSGTISKYSQCEKQGIRHGRVRIC